MGLLRDLRSLAMTNTDFFRTLLYEGNYSGGIRREIPIRAPRLASYYFRDMVVFASPGRWYFGCDLSTKDTKKKQRTRRIAEFFPDGG